MKIALIGRVAEGRHLFDGQTVKTRNLYELFQSMESIEEVILVDTYEYKKNLLGVFIGTLKAMKKCDKIVLSVSVNGRKLFFPLLYYLNKIFRKEIYHSLIGGRLAMHVKQTPSWIKYINSFEANWVESREIVENLKDVGVQNGVYLPNFKNIPILSDLKPYHGTVYRFCTFSRVQRKKGIEDAIDAINNVNTKVGYEKAILDIYGPIDDDYKDEFEKILKANPIHIRYMGCVEADKSVASIRGYYALIFPTRYFNEGIPGTIIDALASGVPVIARRWHYCDEMLEDGVTGYVYDFDKPEKLEKCIERAIEENDRNIDMKKACVKKAAEYLPEEAEKIILSSFK